MARLDDPIFRTATITRPSQAGHDLAAIKTYRYLRLGMLVAVVVLTYSVLEEYFKPRVHCFIGSFSGYYYTPIHSVFIGVMVAIGLALIVIKGRTALEDTFLSLAGMMAPIVAFLPTTDDANGVCRSQMLAVGDYLPVVKPFGAGSKLDPRFIASAISNNLHALVVAGFAAMVVLGIGIFIQWRLHKASMAEYTKGTRNNLIVGLAVVFTVWGLITFDYSWVLQQHAKAACAMFLFLAGAALTNLVVGWKSNKALASTYGGIGLLMIVAGILFAINYELGYRSWLGGHLVLAIEAFEILMFFIYWSIQTVDRWSETV